MRIYQPLYDKLPVDDGTKSLRFFQVPLGGTAMQASIINNRPVERPDKLVTQIDTNMDQGGYATFFLALGFLCRDFFVCGWAS